MFLVYLIAHAIIESAYIFTYGPAYASMVRGLLKNPTTPPNQLLYAVLAYIPFFIATYIIVVKPAYYYKRSLKESILIAVLFGAAVYGVYNLTNMFIMKGYNVTIAVRDMLYGVFSMVALVLLAHYHNIMFK